MLPASPTTNASNLSVTDHGIEHCQLPAAQWALADIAHLRGCQFDHSVPFAATGPVAAFGVPVVHVVLVRAEKQVRRVHARRIVASVQDKACPIPFGEM